MTSEFERESAKIYQFPVRGRMTGAIQVAAKPVPTVSAQVARALGSSWYHEEAVQEALEAERARKN